LSIVDAPLLFIAFQDESVVAFARKGRLEGFVCGVATPITLSYSSNRVLASKPDARAVRTKLLFRFSQEGRRFEFHA
jgi:hypothetical protein